MPAAKKCLIADEGDLDATVTFKLVPPTARDGDLTVDDVPTTSTSTTSPGGSTTTSVKPGETTSTTGPTDGSTTTAPGGGPTTMAGPGQVGGAGVGPAADPSGSLPITGSDPLPLVAAAAALAALGAGATVTARRMRAARSGR